MKEYNPIRYEWGDFIPCGKGLERYIKRNEEKLKNLDEVFIERLHRLVIYQSLIFATTFTGAVMGGYLILPTLEKLLK